ncbi:MAG: hypothetical protein J6A09_02005, partial [Alphaproteobacteria bacterium]|nr:hypothetical protein [Alphaproteobacteria bacterium]
MMDELLNGGAVDAESFAGGNELPPFSLTNQDEMMTPVHQNNGQSLMTPVVSQEEVMQTPVLNDVGVDEVAQTPVLSSVREDDVGAQTLFDDDDDEDDMSVLSLEGKMCRINFLENGVSLEQEMPKAQA